MDADRDFDTVIAEEADGMYVLPARKDENFKIREILDYCRQRGIKTSEITKDELDKFRW